MKELIRAFRLCASEPERCTTKGRKVVVNRTLVGVVWIREGLLIRGIMVAGHCQHSMTGIALSHDVSVAIAAPLVSTLMWAEWDPTPFERRLWRQRTLRQQRVRQPLLLGGPCSGPRAGMGS